VDDAAAQSPFELTVVADDEDPMVTSFPRFLLSSLLAALSVANTVRAEDWPMLGRNQSRNPVSPEKNPPTWWLLGDKKTSRNIKWRVDLSARNKADPVVSGGLVWVGGDRPRGFKDRAPVLMCFREKDGKFLYQYVTVLPPGEQFAELKWVGHTSSPFIEGERMWFTTVRGETVCLDIGPLQRGTGEPRLLWKVDMHKDLGVYPSQAPMGYGKSCSIAGFGDFVYVQTGNGADWDDNVPAPKAPSLVCFHKNTGKLIWSDHSPGKNIRDGQYASPLVVSINGKGQVIAPMGDGWVRSFEALTGELLWKFNANPPNVERKAWKNLYATPVYYDGRVYIGSGNNPVHALNSGNGALCCLDPTKRGDISPEIKTDSGKFAANPNSGMVWRFNGENKNDLPRFGDTNASVAIDRGLVIAVSVAGYVHCLNAKTGQRYWVYDTLEELSSAPLIVDGKIFVAADFHIRVLELAKDLKVLAEIDMDELLFAAPVFANGVLYVATNKSLVAIASKDQAPVRLDWPQFGRDRTRNAVSPEKDPPLWWQAGQIDDKGKALPDKNIRWSAKLGSSTYGDPVVVDGMVWIGTNNDGEKKRIDASVLLCLDEKSGEELYRYVSPRLGGRANHDWPYSSMACSPLSEGNRLWFTTNRCEVVCLDIGPLRNRIGQPRVLWKVDMRQKLGVFPKGSPMALARRSSIASYKDLIYVITGNGVDEGNINVPAPHAPSLVCFNKNTGQVVWTDNSPGKNILHGQWASPLVIEVKGKPQVVAPQGDGWVRSFHAQSGKLIWAFDTNPKNSAWKFQGTRNNLLATPVFYENRIYIGNGHHPEHGGGPGWLYCIDPTKTGDISPELLAGPGKGKPNPNSGMVWKFGGQDAKTKQLRFHRTVSNVAIHQGLVIAPDISGYIHCLDARTGKEYWTHDARDMILGSPLIVDDKIYVGTGDEVCILALAKEKKVWEPIEMPNKIDCSPIFAHGTLYLATRNWLYAVAGNEKNPADVEAGYWPQWRGPDRTNISPETGLLKSWPVQGPPLVWKTQGLGTGARSLAIAGGRIFTLGYHDGKEHLLALEEETGKLLWKFSLGPDVKESPIMQWLSQRTPTIDEDRVYAVGAKGNLVCLEVKRGSLLWQKNYAQEFDGAPGRWGYCDYPLVEGDRLICTPGGVKATIVALDKRTGKLLWQCEAQEEKRGSHAPIIAATIAGQRMLIHQLEKGTVGISALDGRVLWRYEGTGNVYGNVHAALVKGDLVFCSNGFGTKSALVKIVVEQGRFKPVVQYEARLRLDAWLGSSVLVNDEVHTSCGWRIDWKTGKVVEHLTGERPLKGTMVYANGNLIHRTPDNKILLTEITAKGYVPKGEFKLPLTSKAPAWSFPVIAAGKLYLRDQDVILCYDIVSKKKERNRSPDAIFVPTPQDVVEKMLELAEVRKTDLVYDLGCGDGRIVVTAAKKYGCRAAGFDLDPDCVKLSQLNVEKEKVEKLVAIERKDIFTLDLSKADVVALYLLPKLNAKLIPQLQKLKPGARIVSHQFPMEGIKPHRVVRCVSKEDGVAHTLYLWVAPLNKE
jgi:outer membrane protein assembly factor BamB/precorrin-6B methylase 2